MRLSEYLSESLILLDLNTESKIEAFRAMVSKLAHANIVSEPQTFLKEVIAREEIEPTCVGHGIALPHARTRCVDRPVIIMARAKRGIPFTPTPQDRVQLIFMIGTPADAPNLYLQVLSQLCRLLRNHAFREQLLSATTSREVLQLLSQEPECANVSLAAA
ncbi:MAG: PTS sugar transporter subunit IIA [candidate division KSB1 bacterium]|nr:PTS sugar transporter subunit IIA [candidate division KSB1 bacterium]MDZ7274442.1 PTS sugar transporter subunit IIA [candidate division KSB1 bacterium]MDZ7284896.1 PTS sugar transporter subunit IIA [candidate division KSB1 bacterium]MDZ7297683.1 PTS sugar transporter subunit IIA [candidate division KSB1 bacterium]MDZ7305893.1 PTS sugar transporter subunit IIA [candidate division KSB1 bacterium]